MLKNEQAAGAATPAIKPLDERLIQEANNNSFGGKRGDISYTDDGRVELEWYSPAGEDFLICVKVENFPRAIFEEYENFDIDDHIEMWVEAKRNGTGGIPSVRRLVIDAEAICEELEALAGALMGVA